MTGELQSFDAQAELLAGWLEAIDPADFGRASVLAGWDLRLLLAHVLLIKRGLGTVLVTRSGEAPIPAADYVRRYRRIAEEIVALTAEVAADHAPADLVALLRTPTQLEAVPDRTVVKGLRGPITARDWVVTRLIDLVVHCDDFSRSLPTRDPVPLHRPALATVVRATAEILAAQAPGRSVEVRVPPFVAVQAIAGPRHTRGTPPNVVETGPLTWLRLATGRITFAEAAGRAELTASGNRADLTDQLPVLS